ncbi:MAG: hypothetical protein KJ822_16645 [Proteobacteria bacterium]|nr:hypothetical protein [Pseudomonadota bacterium]
MAMRKHILGTVLTAMAVVLMAFSPAMAQLGYGGDPGIADELRKNRKYQQKRDEKADRDSKAQKDEQETRAQDGRRESAYRQSKAAHRAKVRKMKKAAGEKPHNSWQLKH